MLNRSTCQKKSTRSLYAAGALLFGLRQLLVAALVSCQSKQSGFRFPLKTIRPQKVTVQALNEYGEEIIVTGEDEMAKCFCHELEHLDGEIFLDRAIEEIVLKI